MQGIPYKGYLIRVDSQALRSGGWMPRAWVVSPGGPRGAQQSILPQAETRPTLQQANQYAIELAKKWIDAHGR
jgi:hypothetical protein